MAPLAMLACALAGSSPGIASASSSPKLWATVNLCDTAAAPNSMGVRAGMPGTRRAGRLFLRFRAEYWSPTIQAWAPVAYRGVSPWVSAGPARYERRQTGWTFEFAPPPAGVTYTMRAIVEFEWRRPGPSRRVVRSVSRVTETGIRGVAGGDPVGTSKAMCLIS